MTGDQDLAELLGEAPERIDPPFRWGVLARVARRARRRQAARRAFAYALVFTAIGLSFPAAKAVGFDWAELQPLLPVAGALALAYVLATVATEGPRAALTRSRVLLRAHP